MTTDREKLARQWAKTVQKFDPGSTPIHAAAEYILEHTAPPSMADVEWNHEKHYLAGVEYDDGDHGVMVKPDHGGNIWVFAHEERDIFTVNPADLTPNGKRYELREVPEVLKTLEDYKNAPDATLAASMHGEGYIHNETMSRWESTHGDWKNYAEMESSSPSGRMVLRRGWGGEA